MQLPYDVLRYLPNVGNMTVPEILNYCRADKRLQETICQNRDFWVSQGVKWLTSNPDNLADLDIGTIQNILLTVQRGLTSTNDLWPLVKDLIISEPYYFGFLGLDKLSDKYRNDLNGWIEYILGAIAGNHPEIYTSVIDIESNMINERFDILEVLRNAILAENLELIEFLVSKIQEQEQEQDINIDHLIPLVIHRANPEIFDYFLETFGRNRFHIHDIILRDNKLYQVLFNFPRITHPHIIDTLLPDAHPVDVEDLFNRIVRLEDTPDLRALVKHIIESRADLNINNLMTTALSFDKIHYIELLLPLLAEESRRRLITSPYNLQLLELFEPYYQPEDYPQVLWNVAVTGKDMIPYLAEKVSQQDIFDAWAKAVIGGDMHTQNLAEPYHVSEEDRMETLLKYLPYLRDVDIAFARRAAQKMGDDDLLELIEEHA